MSGSLSQAAEADSLCAQITAHSCSSSWFRLIRIRSYVILCAQISPQNDVWTKQACLTWHHWWTRYGFDAGIERVWVRQTSTTCKTQVANHRHQTCLGIKVKISKCTFCQTAHYGASLKQRCWSEVLLSELFHPSMCECEPAELSVCLPLNCRASLWSFIFSSLGCACVCWW